MIPGCIWHCVELNCHKTCTVSPVDAATIDLRTLRKKHNVVGGVAAVVSQLGKRADTEN